MAGKNDKWLMFRNYMINELGITKEDIREWIEDAVRIEAKKLAAETFARENLEQMIRRIVYDSGYFKDNSFNRTVIETAAKCVCKGIELYMQKYRIYNSNDELIPMTNEQFKEELINHKTEKFCKYYFERYDKYRKGELSESTGIQRGDKFLCIKDVIMNNEPDEIAYFQGEIYLSENEGCITDEYGDKSHWWVKEEEINSYFKKIQP